MFNRKKVVVICILASISLGGAILNNGCSTDAFGVRTRSYSIRHVGAMSTTVGGPIVTGTIIPTTTTSQTEKWIGKLQEERRKAAERIIKDKYNTIKNEVPIGNPDGDIEFCEGTQAYIQHYTKGLIMYHESVGAAFVMYGPVWNMYRNEYATSDRRAELGYMVIDTIEIDNKNYKSVFSRGAIFYSHEINKAIPVLGQIFLDFENLGGPSNRNLGFPTKKAEEIRTGGFFGIGKPLVGYKQDFENGQIYYDKSKPTAYEVHGAILAKYLEKSGWPTKKGGLEKWGFPISNQSYIYGEVKDPSGAPILGLVSHFEKCDIYYGYSGEGTHIIESEFLHEYHTLKGPLGELGFPISDTIRTGSSSTTKIHNFKEVSLLWHKGKVVHAKPFRIWISYVDTYPSDGWSGENDLSIRARLGYLKDTFPFVDLISDLSWKVPGGNTVSVDEYIPMKQLEPPLIPDQPGKKIRLIIDVKDRDGWLTFKDDILGSWKKDFTVDNCWGYAEMDTAGIIESPKFKHIKKITISIHPEIDISTLSEAQKWWGSNALNRPTNDISWEKYDLAFTDVESDPDWMDYVNPKYWFRKLFYELFVKDLAEAGNCFGMSLEGIRARRQDSMFALPINKLDWSAAVDEFNIKHCYQVGAPAVWWFLKQFITGNTHDPKDVYKRTKELYEKGSTPILCVSQSYDFGGKPHAVMPIKYETTGQKRDITVCDPYYTGNDLKHIVITEDNKFVYRGRDLYDGGDWTGGRFYYIPYSVVSSRPKTPVDDFFLLMLSGTVILLGGGAETQGISDGCGNDLNAFGLSAMNMLKQGKHLDGFFLNMKGFGENAIAGEFLIRNEPSSDMDRNFIHRFKGGLQYAVKYGFTEFQITGESKPNDLHTFEVQNLGTIKNHLILKSDRNKPAKLEVMKKLGIGQDSIYLTVDSLLSGPNQTLELSIKPGLGDLEILNPDSGQKKARNIQVRMSATLDGQKINRKWEIPLEDGISINISGLYKKELTYSRIDRIFGPAISTQQLQ